jgi:hypothetical protein
MLGFHGCDRGFGVRCTLVMVFQEMCLGRRIVFRRVCMYFCICGGLKEVESGADQGQRLSFSNGQLLKGRQVAWNVI